MLSATEQLQEYCDQYLFFRRTGGALLRETEKILRRFIKFCSPYLGNECCVPEEAVKVWGARHSNETDSTIYKKANEVRAFAEYLQSKGVKAYVGERPRSKANDYVPYIFTNAELAALFNAADSIPLNHVYPGRKVTLPLIFRMIYACGLRESEAVNLTVERVDIKDGILTILDAKFDKDRLVSIHPVLLEKLIEYSKTPYFPQNPKSPFFVSAKGTAYSPKSIYDAFRIFLLTAGISHGGRGKGPRVHDLRHTFAVHCLRNWVRNGEDLSVAMPYLSAYLGHTGLQNSQIYLHLTAEMFPDIVESVEQKFDVLPDWSELRASN